MRKAYRKNSQILKVFKLSLRGMNAVSKTKSWLISITHKLKALFSLWTISVLFYSLNRIITNKLNIDCILKCINIIMRISTYYLIITEKISSAVLSKRITGTVHSKDHQRIGRYLRPSIVFPDSHKNCK